MRVFLETIIASMKYLLVVTEDIPQQHVELKHILFYFVSIKTSMLE